MPKLKVIIGSATYRLQSGENLSEESDYGQPVTLEADGKHYIAFVDLDDNDEPSTPLDSLVYECKPVESEEESEEEGEEESEEEEEEETAN